MYTRLVESAFKNTPTEGDIGIEVEMELDNYIKEEHLDTDLWRVDGDNSLKGISYELVTKNPISFDTVEPAISGLRNTLHNSGANIKPTVRAGVHIHLNAQKMTVAELFHFLLVYYPLEVVLTKFCGDGREGNLFCLRGVDAAAISQALERCVLQKSFKAIYGDFFRYSALNLQSLFTYGSVEFRALSTTQDMENINTWCKIIKRLKEYSSTEVKNSWDCLAKISSNGPTAWAEEVLGEELFNVVRYEGMGKDINRSMREFQYLAHLLKTKGV